MQPVLTKKRVKLKLTAYCTYVQGYDTRHISEPGKWPKSTNRYINFGNRFLC